jgi:hypothetical protein
MDSAAASCSSRGGFSLKTSRPVSLCHPRQYKSLSRHSRAATAHGSPDFVFRLSPADEIEAVLLIGRREQNWIFAAGLQGKGISDLGVQTCTRDTSTSRVGLSAVTMSSVSVALPVFGLPWNRARWR